MSEPGFIKDAIILFVITLVAGACLGGVHEMTKDPIAAGTPGSSYKKLSGPYSRMRQALTTAGPGRQVPAAAESIADWGYGKCTVNDAEEALDATGNQIRIPYYRYFRRRVTAVQCSDCSRYLSLTATVPGIGFLTLG